MKEREIQVRLESASRVCEWAQKERALPNSSSDTETRRFVNRILDQPNRTLRDLTHLLPKDIPQEEQSLVHMGLYHYTPRPSPKGQYTTFTIAPNITTLIPKN